jgi:hypothetical protein
MRKDSSSKRTIGNFALGFFAKTIAIRRKTQAAIGAEAQLCRAKGVLI